MKTSSVLEMQHFLGNILATTNKSVKQPFASPAESPPPTDLFRNA